MERTSWGSTIFCDDIRQEVAGKYSLMGIYENEMLFQTEPPWVLQKMCLLIKYTETHGGFDEDLRMTVTLPGDQKDKPSLVSMIARKDVKIEPRVNIPEDVDSLIGFAVPFLFSQLTVNTEGFIKVRIERGKIETRIGALHLRKVRPDEKTPF